MPKAVAELDVVILLAKPGDIPVWVADQPCGVQQVAAWSLRVFLDVLAPLGADYQAAVDVQARFGDGALGALRPHGLGDAAHDRDEKRGLGRFQEAGGEHLVDQRPAARPEHAAEFAVGAAQVPDQAQHVAAPDKVGGPGGNRKVLDGADLEDDAAALPRARGLPVPGARIDADDVQTEARGQADGMPARTASRVDRGRSGRQLHSRHVVVQGLGSDRIEGLVQRLVEPRLDAIVRIMQAYRGSGIAHGPMMSDRQQRRPVSNSLCVRAPRA